jgi:aspartyl/asparaginyl beta-hydroxylase (cupin superfamily)
MDRQALPPTDNLPFIAALEARAPVIREEYLRLERDLFAAWPETELYETGWEVFGFQIFGKRQDLNCLFCPETSRAVEAIPGMVTAGFSRLAPGTTIRPHRGYTDAVLRCHLGLIVPPDCALKVDGTTVTWEEGRCLLFDDTFEHEAWNHSDQDRIVLLIDIARSAIDAISSTEGKPA